MSEHPPYAVIHVSPSPGSDEFPVVARVNGGWQSGGHHYPDSTVLDVKPLYLSPVPVPERIRDGVPTVDEIRTACRLLQIPLDEDGMGLENMTPERQVTVLLAILSAWIVAYEFTHDLVADRLTPEEMAVLISSAQAEVTDGVAAASMNAAIWHIQWAGYIVTEIGRDGMDNPSSPASALHALLQAAALALTSWRDIQDGQHGFVINGDTYSVGDGTLMMRAGERAADALAAIRKMLPPEQE